MTDFRLRGKQYKSSRAWSPRFAAWAFILPSLTGLLVFFLVPSIDVLRLSFLDNTGTNNVGLDNYSALFANEAFLLASANTVKFMLVCIPILLVASLAIALFLRKSTPFRKLMKTAILVPLAIPTFTAALLISITFDSSGIANGLLNFFGLAPVRWLDSDMAFWVLVGDYIWRNLGYCVVLWLAALVCISDDLYDAARIDGASSRQIVFRVTIPLLLPSGAVVLVLAIINAFKVYREAYLVSGNYPHESMYLLPHLFNNWFSTLSISKLAAGGVMLAAVLFVIVCILHKAWSKNDRGER